ncbi:DNA sulfur modification protein DndB [Priestia filamentosa]|uniref:DNA sulfur modification protein DndB n=1 Tax=Priestia filamentosa TaxID=1402861 RepID=UPI003D2843C1
MFDVKVLGAIDIINSNNAKGVLSSQMKIKDVLNLYKIDKTVNRDVSYLRIPKIVRYIENENTNTGIFFPAFVFSFRGDPLPYYRDEFELQIPSNEKLIVIDGQHRIKALEKYVETIEEDSQKELFLNSSVTVQIYFGLSINDEKRLFADINSNAKRVSMSLITKFDSRDILNVLVTELYNVSDALQVAKIDFEKSRLVRPSNDYFATSMRLKGLISLILFGKKTLNKKDLDILKDQYDDIISFLNRLFEELFNVLPANPGDVLSSILGHYGTQQALGYYIHNSIIINNKDMIGWVSNWEEDIEQLGAIDWTLNNPSWKKFLSITRKNTPYEYFVINEFAADQIYEIIKKDLY